MIECKCQDRSSWSPGPWDNEPDRAEFEHAGLPCIIHRGGGGAWCGYVGLTAGHPAHGKGYNDLEVEVHGGLTYACGGCVCPVPKPGESDDLWWLGFDCSHAGDVAPRRGRTEMIGEPLPWGGFSAYRDQAYVTSETKRLAEQLAALAEGGAA